MKMLGSYIFLGSVIIIPKTPRAVDDIFSLAMFLLFLFLMGALGFHLFKLMLLFISLKSRVRMMKNFVTMEWREGKWPKPKPGQILSHGGVIVDVNDNCVACFQKDDGVCPHHKEDPKPCFVRFTVRIRECNQKRCDNPEHYSNISFPG